jgi:uncharacterized protein Yka (UPF0111/DUF47 family)
MFDSSISLGNILTIGMFIVGITTYVVSNNNSAKVLDVRLAFIDAQLEDFKTEMKKLAEVIFNQTKLDSRVDRVTDTLIATGKRLDETSAAFTKRVENVEKRVDDLQERLTRYLDSSSH